VQRQFFSLVVWTSHSGKTPEDALQYGAVQLFMQSARRVVPDYELTRAELDYVARICRLVDGMPLGILLAAAWLDTLPADEIAEEIAESIDFLENRYARFT
jgi:predicted ATPase